MSDYRREESSNVRASAARLAADRPKITHKANGDEQRYASANYAMNFTKGLEHDHDTGLITNPQDFESFRTSGA